MNYPEWQDTQVYHGEYFKMRWYKTNGDDKGNLACETYHKSKEEMYSIQQALFYMGIDFMYRPTMWVKIPGGWDKINDIV